MPVNPNVTELVVSIEVPLDSYPCLARKITKGKVSSIFGRNVLRACPEWCFRDVISCELSPRELLHRIHATPKGRCQDYFRGNRLIRSSRGVQKEQQCPTNRRGRKAREQDFRPLHLCSHRGNSRRLVSLFRLIEDHTQFR